LKSVCAQKQMKRFPAYLRRLRQLAHDRMRHVLV
jgi:hypothetical protein